jgi:hypothetical protein
MRRTFMSAITATFLVPFIGLSAQQPPTIEPGTRVRVIATACRLYRQAARFEAMNGGVLVVVTDTTVTCALGAVSRLDVARGRRSNWSRGAFLGGFVGALAGVGVGAAWSTGCRGFPCPDSEEVLFMGGGGLVAGALLGAGIGALVKTDRWEEVPLDRLRVSFAPKRHGRFALGFTCSF